MDNPIVISLAVTGVGMLVLFLSLALLYGLMILMTTLIKDRPEAGKPEGESAREQEAEARRRRAAVVAVALARAELERSPATRPDTFRGGVALSPWRAYHRQRLLNLTRRTRASR